MSIITESRLTPLINVGPDTLQPAIIEGEYGLEYGDALSIERMGQTLYVVSGCAWITRDGQDIILQAGQEMILEPGPDPAVVSALESDSLVYRIFDRRTTD